MHSLLLGVISLIMIWQNLWFLFLSGNSAVLLSWYSPIFIVLTFRAEPVAPPLGVTLWIAPSSQLWLLSLNRKAEQPLLATHLAEQSNEVLNSLEFRLGGGHSGL